MGQPKNATYLPFGLVKFDETLSSDTLNGLAMHPEPTAVTCPSPRRSPELSHDFSLSVKAAPGDYGADDAIVGTPAYAHEVQRGATRKTKAVGAVD